MARAGSNASPLQKWAMTALGALLVLLLAAISSMLVVDERDYRLKTEVRLQTLERNPFPTAHLISQIQQDIAVLKTQIIQTQEQIAQLDKDLRMLRHFLPSKFDHGMHQYLPESDK